MKNLKKNQCFFRGLYIAIALFISIQLSVAQPRLPQKTITVIPTQALHFGTFAVTGGAGGSITVGYDGSISSIGNIVPLATIPTAQPAIFEIKLCQGRNVIISYESTTFLTGSEGGSLMLEIGPTEKGVNNALFMTNSDCNFITPLRVGGTLNVPGGALSGIYTGS